MSELTRLWAPRGSLGMVCGAAAVWLGACSTPASPPPAAPAAELLADDDAAVAASGGLAEGEAALSRGDFAAARRIFSDAIRKQPSQARAHHYLGVSHDGLGDVEAAMQSYRKALELDPKLAEASVNLSANLMDAQDAEGALGVVERALSRSPRDAALLYNRALALEALGRAEEALAAFGRAVQADPTNEAVRFAHADALLHSGAKDEALAVLRELSAARSLEVLASTARLLGRLRHYPECIAALDRALGMRQAPELYVDRGLCKHGQKDEQGALQDFESAVAKDESFAPAHYYLGMHLKGLGKKRDARAALQRAAEVGEGQRVGEAARRALDTL